MVRFLYAFNIETSGSVYRRVNPGGTASWLAHVSWYEAGRRRQTKRAFRTKKEAQAWLVEALGAHRAGNVR